MKLLLNYLLSVYLYVALFARAWIEIEGSIPSNQLDTVALFARAWIEIDLLRQKLWTVRSPSLRGRGLK